MNSKIKEIGNNYMILGNNRIIQWGKSSNNTTVTLYKPFTSLTYTIATSLLDAGSHTTNLNAYNLTLTNFQVQYGNGNVGWIAAGY